MANKKISELTAATTPAETDVMPIVQSSATKKATVSAWVRGALLTGLSTATNAAIAATDSVLVALGKAQAQITGHIGNATTAHGMTTPGAAIVQAASVADQRAAMGLANHEKVTVNESARLTANGGIRSGDQLELMASGVHAWSWNTTANAGYLSLANEGIGYPLRISKDGSRFIFGGAADNGTDMLQVGGAVNAVGVHGNMFYLPDYSIGEHQGDGVFSLVRARYGFGPEIRARVDGGTSNRWLKLGLRDNNGVFGTMLDVYEDRIDAWGPVQAAGNITQSVDNLWSIGTASRRATTAYLATNPIIGSDSRLKTDIEEIPAAIAADIMQSLRPVTFRYKVGGQEAYEEDEDYEEQAQVTESVEVPKTTVQIVDGKAVQVTTTETVQQPVYDECPLVDGDGKPVMQLVTPAVLNEETGEEITPAVYMQAIHREPRMTTVTKTRKVTKYREVEGKRYHAGYIAQEVKAALDAVADRWPAAADLALWLLSDTTDADSTQMVRMEQMIPIIHAAMRYRAQVSA